VDECHYRSPETSVRSGHRRMLHGQVGSDPAPYVRALLGLALEGVDGNPGGQDNVAVAAVRT